MGQGTIEYVNAGGQSAGKAQDDKSQVLSKVQNQKQLRSSGTLKLSKEDEAIAPKAVVAHSKKHWSEQHGRWYQRYSAAL